MEKAYKIKFQFTLEGVLVKAFAYVNSKTFMKITEQKKSEIARKYGILESDIDVIIAGKDNQ